MFCIKYVYAERVETEEAGIEVIVRHEFLPILKNNNYAKTAHLWKCANRYEYFELAFLLLRAEFGSSTSPNSADRAV